MAKPPSKLNKAFKSILAELTIASDGIVMRGEQIMIPESMQKTVIERAHKAHLGQKLMRNLLKKRYFWHGMNKMIAERISNCLPCQAVYDTTKPKPIISSTLPSNKFELVSIDFSSKTPSNNYILVLLDEFSRYPIFEFTSNITSKKAIHALDRVFKVLGVPKRIKSDNGSAFRSEKFKKFAQEKGFAHEKITPEHPHSNSICERFMSNKNKQIQIAKINGANWKNNLEQFLRDYRATPHSTTSVSPNDLLGFDDKNEWPSKSKSITFEELSNIAKRKREK